MMNNFQKPEFYKLFENYISEALELLASFNINNEMILKDDETYEVWMIVLRNFKTLQELKGFLAIKNWLMKNPEIHKHFENYVGYGIIHFPPSLDDVLRRHVYEHIINSGMKPNQKKIQEMYSKLEKFLISENILVFINVPLSGLTVEENIQIEPGLQIHKLDEKSKFRYNKGKEYWKPKIESVIVHQFNFPKLFMSQSEAMDSKKNIRLSREVMDTSKRLIEALRIFKSGKFGATIIIESSPYLENFDHQPEKYGMVKNKFLFEDVNYVINNVEVENFRSFWEMYKKIMPNKQLNFLLTPIHRFMDIYNRDSFIDSTIDLMICLETLFTIGKTPTKTLKNRISKFLEPDNKIKRDDLFRFLEVAYDLRSDIVHGDDKVNFFLDGKKIDPWDITSKLGEIVRACLKKLVSFRNDTKFSKEKMIKDLD